MGWFRRKRAVDDTTWERVVRSTPILSGLPDERRARVRELTAEFLGKKSVEGCGGLDLDPTMEIAIAAQACAMVVDLGLDALREVKAVLVYPDEFRSKWTFEDEFGIVTEEDRPLSGEAWSDGPVVLSWRDIQAADDSYNVVVHEFAHKLDMLTGEEDGVPPLPPGTSRDAWEADFAAARDDLEQRDAAGEETAIDAYAAENPAEGFAVFSEVFFEAPALLAVEYPKVHDHLARFYSARSS